MKSIKVLKVSSKVSKGLKVSKVLNGASRMISVVSMVASPIEARQIIKFTILLYKQLEYPNLEVIYHAQSVVNLSKI